MKRNYFFALFLIISSLNVFAGGGGADFNMAPASHPGSCIALEFSNTSTSASSQSWTFSPTAYYASNGTAIGTMVLDSGDVEKIYWPSAGDKQICLDGTCETFHSCNCNAFAADELADAPLICNSELYCGTTSSTYSVDADSISSSSLHSGSLENNSWIKFIADASNISFDIEVLGGCSMQFAVYELTTSGGSQSFTLFTDIDWTSVDGFTGNNTINASGLTAGNEYYIHFDGDGGAECDYELSFSSGAQLLAVNATSTTACAGSPATLSVTPADPATNYTWTDNFGNSYPNSSSIVVNPNVNTSYYVQVEGCQNLYDTIDITTCAILPIELLGFSAECKNDYALLQWQTASEINNDYFILEKSSDGFNFSPIGMVDGAGNSSTVKSYSFQDFESMQGAAYYRLTQIDFNGDQSSSNVIMLNKCIEVNYQISNLYYNHNANELVIDYSINKTTDVQIKVFDMQGKLVSDNNHTLYQNQSQTKLQTTQFISGSIYLINIISSKSVTSQKVLIPPNSF